MGTAEPTLLALAESIADGAAVDWAVTGSLSGAEDQAIVRQLRVIAELATLHRTLPLDPAALPPAIAARRTASAPAVGRWAHLDLIERLGGGTFGEVYRAWDRHLEREVALKLLRAGAAPDEAPQSSRIVTEGRLLARLHHPNVVTVYGVAMHEGRVGLWMELVSGATMEQLLFTKGPFGSREAAIVGIDLCRALAALHKAGLIHRDIKTQNVVREAGGRIVLMDLGTGRTIDPLRPHPLPDLAGTPLYLAPEIFEGAAAGERSDLYSLGVLLYRLVTGAFPVRAATIDELRDAHAAHRVVRLRDARPDLPTVFVRIVDRAIAATPAERYASAGELEADLIGALDESRTQDAADALSHARDPRRRSVSWPITGTIAVIVLVLTLAALRWKSVPAPNAPGVVPGSIRSIAVLPLANLSGDPAQEYFADGMTDELIGTLGQLRDVNVISRTSVMLFKGSKQPLPAIAKALNVDAILEGSVLQQNKRVRINARLIYAGTDTQLWDRTFESVLGDVLALQGNVAKAVTDQIGVSLVARRPAVDLSRAQGLDAFDLYLRGRYYWNKRTKDDLRRSIQYFQQAIDDGYAPAYSGISDAYNLLGFYGLIPQADARQQALTAATKALESDESLAEAHASLAFVHDQRLEWEEAENHFQRALALKPGYATAHHWYSLFLLQRRRFDESLAEATRALTLDPLSNGVNGNVGYVYFCSGNYAKAVAQLEKSVQMDPGFARNHVQLAEAYAVVGAFDRALAELDKAAAVGGVDAVLRADIGYVNALAGRRTRARAVIAELSDRYRAHEPGAARGLAVVYAALGERDRAFYWLDRAFEILDPEIADTAVDPRFNALHADARFANLLADFGLPQ